MLNFIFKVLVNFWFLTNIGYWLIIKTIMKPKISRSNTYSKGFLTHLKTGVTDFSRVIKDFAKQFSHPIRLYQEATYQCRKVFKVIWPINWTKLYNTNLVFKTLKNTSQRMKIVLTVLLVCLLISFISLLGSVFNTLSVETADNTGTFNEAIFGQTISRINPALTLNSEAEKKLADLIYQPLYRLEYPNFVDSKDKVTIKPVLLESEPAWSSDNKVLKLRLKRELKWSDGTPLESKDVVYTFNRIKETNGNADFRDIYANYKLVATSPIEMELLQIAPNKGFNPQMKYLMNFYPISAKYFEDKNTDDISGSPKSLANEISSGYFTMPTKVKIDNKEIQNPIKDVSGYYNTLVLERNRLNNYNSPLVERYVMKVYNDLVDVGGANNNSVERASVNKKVDLFVRQNYPENSLTEENIKSRLQIEQTMTPTNTYYIMYANLQSNQWLINTLLRKYVLCVLSETEPNQSNLSKIATNKQFTPIQLQDSFDGNCSTAKLELLAQQKAGKTPYTEQQNKIEVDGENIDLNILTLQELSPLLKPVQEKISAAGLTSNVSAVKDADELDRKISEKAYNLVFLPTTIISNDPYPMYGAKSRNISSINRNNRIGKAETKFGEGIEKTLKDYSESNLSNAELQNQVRDFFKNEYVSLNMYSSSIEINYSLRVKFINQNTSSSNIFNNVITFSHSVYQNLPQIYVETKKKFFWQ
jgi:Bacterial extracellular solute-binding proteins, family 5 Middle